MYYQNLNLYELEVGNPLPLPKNKKHGAYWRLTHEEGAFRQLPDVSC